MPFDRLRANGWSESPGIITSGLSGGEKVIVDGAIKVRPGSPIGNAKPVGQ